MSANTQSLAGKKAPTPKKHSGNQHLDKSLWLVFLKDGPLAGRFMRLEAIERILVLSSEIGALKYVRTRVGDLLVEYEHLSKEREEQLELEQGILKLSGLLDPDSEVLLWVAQFKYSKELIKLVRSLGFNFDWDAKEWRQLGSRKQLAGALEEIERHPGIRLSAYRVGE